MERVRLFSCKMLVVALLFSFVVIPPGVFGEGERDYITITKVRVDSNGIVIVDFPQNSTQYGTPPACATISNRMTADANTAGGKAILEAALTAYLSGRQVYLDGTGLCTQDSTMESIFVLQLH